MDYDKCQNIYMNLLLSFRRYDTNFIPQLLESKKCDMVYDLTKHI